MATLLLFISSNSSNISVSISGVMVSFKSSTVKWRKDDLSLDVLFSVTYLKINHKHYRWWEVARLHNGITLTQTINPLAQMMVEIDMVLR